MRVVGIIFLALASTAASAAPTYLTCSVDQGNGLLAVEVTTDEAEQSATVALPSGRVVTRKALFSPTDVNILDEESTWVVDRVNLGFKRLVDIGDHQSVYKGKCLIKPAPPKRAF